MQVDTAQVITFRAPVPMPGFTARDLMQLGDWHTEGRRLAVEDGRDAVPGFALVYEGGAPWASWGISRQGSEVLVWNCVTLADLGRFGSMLTALAALPATVDDMPGPVPMQPTAQVIRLRPAAFVG